MAWRVQSTEQPERFAAWGDDGLDADEATRADLIAMTGPGKLAPATPTGPFVEVLDLDNELGIFLLATTTDAVPAPRQVIGTPPTGELPEVPDGATP